MAKRKVLFKVLAYCDIHNSLLTTALFGSFEFMERALITMWHHLGHIESACAAFFTSLVPFSLPHFKMMYCIIFQKQ